MKSNKAKGDYYRRKTVKYLEDLGYQVATIEKLQRCFIKGRPIFLKKDVFGADLLAMNSEKIIFVQVKFSSEGKFSVSTVKKEFDKYTFAPFVEKWLVMWEPRKQPNIKVL